MIPRRPFVLVAALLLVAACTAGPGGAASAGGTAPSSSTAAGPCPATPVPDQAGLTSWSPASQNPTVYPQVINPTGSIACGPTRFMFSFLDSKNTPIATPDRSATVTFYDLGADPEKPVAKTTGEFIWAIEDSVGFYVANVDFPTSGQWGAEFATEAPGSPAETIRMQFEVQPESTTIAVGDHAPPSETPTLDDVGGDVSKISTDDQPVTSFYTTSIAQAVAAKQPFVVVFATPKFCTSAQCGPTLDKVKPVAAAHPDLTFINVEPYQLQDKDGQLQPVLTGDPAALTPVAATNEWGLTAEPWTFVVDKTGTVTASFPLIFSDQELKAAIAAVE